MYKRYGSQYWQFVDPDGVRRSTGTENEEAAKAYISKIELQRYEEAHLGIKRPYSWQELCVHWAKEKSHKISWQDDLRAIEWWTKFYRDLRDIRKITREGADEIIQRERPITKEPSPANNTANHYVAYLASMLNAACRKWRWIESAPLLRRYPATDGRKRWLDVVEWRTLENTLPPYLCLPARFALATGLRRGKLVVLRWPEIDISNRSLTFSGTANKLGNTIPLNDTAMSVLAEIQASPVRHMNLVFVNRVGHRLQENQREWYRALDKCGLRGVEGQEDFCWHGLRHTFASWLGQAGVPQDKIKRLGGWASREMVDRYSHLDVESLRSYAAVIDHILEGGRNERTDDAAKRASMGAS